MSALEVVRGEVLPSSLDELAHEIRQAHAATNGDLASAVERAA